MSNFEFYFASDEAIKRRNYKEFVLSPLDQDSLKDIENTIAKGKVTDENREEIVEFLEGLHRRIMAVKRNEYEYEGEQNLNVNEYLMHIQKLLQRVSASK